jgi:hypothetical protein
MLQRLQDGKVESLRQMIYDAGREYPRPELVANVLRPLRSQVSANVAAAMTLRAILDGIIIAYTSFCLEGDKKAPGDNILLSGWHLNDPCEIWLEALTRTGQGHRIDILPVPLPRWLRRFSRSENGFWSPAANSPPGGKSRWSSGSSRYRLK